MNREIERKYLVKDDSYKENASNSTQIKQGYLSTVPDRTVRIRIAGNKGFITIKGKSDASGMSRFEWEKELPLEEAEQLFLLSEANPIEKIRHLVNYKNQTFEVDEFLGNNKGLVMAELELEEHSQKVELPQWLAKEVTGDKRYYNAYLSKHPFINW